MAKLRIEVVYALPGAQDLVVLELEGEVTAREAVAASGIAERNPEIDRNRMRLGVFGQPVQPERRLRDGERVEILRPLAEDPKESRRRRSRRRR